MRESCAVGSWRERRCCGQWHPRLASWWGELRSGPAGSGGSTWEEMREVEAVGGAGGPGSDKGLGALGFAGC